MPSQTAAPQGDMDTVVQALSETRARTLALVGHLDDATLERVHSPLMSPLVWDLGHIAAFEDLWLVHRLGGEALLRPDLAQVYDAFETPRADRGEIPFLRRADALDYLDAVHARTLASIARRGVDPLIHELVIRHEQQHGETMLQTMQLAHLPAPGDALDAPLRSDDAHPGRDRIAIGAGGLELVEVAGGAATLGALPRTDGGSFSYDNERPRHAVELPGFRIGRTPIANATFLTFVEGGGYERREWWSREAWAWKEEYDIERPAGWERGEEGWREWRMDRLVPLDPDAPVVHVSWFEADAFARAHGARLPDGGGVGDGGDLGSRERDGETAAVGRGRSARPRERRLAPLRHRARRRLSRRRRAERLPRHDRRRVGVDVELLRRLPRLRRRALPRVLRGLLRP
jgi:iron(II)-dependent oxidoreductase